MLLGAALTYPQAIFVGLLQGATELFPVSSLGHSVVIPALFGWDNLVRGESSSESFYLAFLVGAHLATAAVLFLFFWKDWKDILQGLVQLGRTRKIETRNQRMAWLLVVATVPAGLTGLLFEHAFRVIFAKPTAASVFLAINGVILLAGERLRRKAHGRESRTSLDGLTTKSALFVGVAQIGALCAGISRSGITMVAGLLRGLSHEDAARFAFLLATPIIGAAGVYKLPDLFGPNGDGVRGQILVGSLVSAAAAFVSVRFLVKYFETKNLNPFGIYCLVLGIASGLYFLT